jgi:hypothetical protein
MPCRSCKSLKFLTLLFSIPRRPYQTSLTQRLLLSSLFQSIYLFRFAAARMIVHPGQAECQRFCAPAGIHEFVSVGPEWRIYPSGLS